VSVQPSPAVQRGVQLVKLLAAEPRTELSLSELARRLGAHRSSCQTLLLALCGEGLVTRVPRPGGPVYKLGSTLVELGAAARASLGVLDLVEAALVRLRDRFGASALAGQASGDAVVVVTAHPVPHPFGYTITTGTRIPLRAPIGALYVAWADGATVDAWCERARPPLSRARRDDVDGELAAIRARGWSATVRSPDGDGAVREASPSDLRRPRTIIGISAPVWDEHGELTCSMALAGFADPLDGPDVRRLAKAIAEEASAVTAATGGRPPTRGPI
jgi:DNA-binding IclR family transcriptional regulator